MTEKKIEILFLYQQNIIYYFAYQKLGIRF